MKHQLLSKFTASAVLAGAVATLSAGPVSACGGFFCSQQQPVNQAAERIIFADNGDGTITAVIQIMYEGPSESFSWVLPISTVPVGDQLGVASDLAFTRLQLATNPQYNLTTTVEGTCRSDYGVNGAGPPAIPLRETCDENPSLGGCGAPGASPANPISVDATGVVGAFEYAVISVDPAVADPAAPARDWLAQNGYDVTPEGAALLGPYLADGMHLLALRLTKGSDTGSIRPIKLTYAAEAPIIPIKLTAVAANSDMGVMTWALSSARAVPFNYNALELNEARINWFNAAGNYDQVVTQAADEAGGQGFVTEYAGPSSQLADVVWRPDEEQDWQSVRNATYMTFAQIFGAVYDRYQGYSGFWDAVRRSVTLDANLAFADFRACPTCYSNRVTFAPSTLFAAIETDVIDPIRSVQQLIDRAPYTTRLYSTLSAADMTADPVFKFNPDLPELSNVHQAVRVTECDSSLYEYQAPWRIDFPQGTTIRGTADSVGAWPDAISTQPANFRVLSLSTTGDGAVLADNTEVINAGLASYNAGVLSPDGVPGTTTGSDGVTTYHSSDSCSLSAGQRPSSPPLPFAVSLASLLGACWLRRRATSGSPEA
jgi:Uncharacterized protein conserved in bacteria (DUF2330)